MRTCAQLSGQQMKAPCGSPLHRVGRSAACLAPWQNDDETQPSIGSVAWKDGRSLNVACHLAKRGACSRQPKLSKR